MSCDAGPWPGRAETVRYCLEILSVCCVSPRVQVIITIFHFQVVKTFHFRQLMLCDKFELPEDSVVGMNMILGPAEGEAVPESAEVQKAALQVRTF